MATCRSAWQRPNIRSRRTRICGAPVNHVVHVREVRLSAGAGFAFRGHLRGDHDHARACRSRRRPDWIDPNGDGLIEGPFLDARARA